MHKSIHTYLKGIKHAVDQAESNCKTACSNIFQSTSPSNISGAVLLTVVVLIVIIGLTGVAIYSLTATSTFSQLSSQNATQAFYLAESGFRVVAGEYNQAAAGNKNAVLENLHNTTLSLPANAGQFDIRLYPYWFYVGSAYTSGDAAISVKMPGGIPLRDPADPGSPPISIPGTGALKLRGKTRPALITSSSVSGDVITFTLDTSVAPPGFPYDIPAGEELFLVVADNATPSQTIVPDADITLPGSNTTAQIWPAENGSFRIYNENNDKMDYSYAKRLPAVIDPSNPPAAISLTQIHHQNPADPSVFPIQINSATEFYLGKNLAVYSTSTFGRGSTAAKKTVGNYTDVGLDAGFSTDKDIISFAEDIQDFSPKMGKGGAEIPAGAANAPITVDIAAKEIELGKNLSGSYGSVWYQGDTDIANCVEGECSLGKGIRAYFEFQSANADTHAESRTYGDGFTFSLISGETNDYTNTGSGGEYLGYAGPGLSNGLRAPKIGLEFDTYPNPGAGNICGSDSRRDDTPVANHAALVYWGEDTPGSFDAAGGYISLGAADWSSTAGTISFWFKRDTINYGNGSSTGDRLWGQHVNMEMRFSSDGLYLHLDWGENTSVTVANPFNNADTWYFLAVTWDEGIDGTLRLYRGDKTTPPVELVPSVYNWGKSVSLAGVTENLFLNSSGGNGGKQFQVDGKGADLRYYNGQRNLAQIQADYNLRLNGNESNLQAYFPLQTDLADMGPSQIAAAAVGSTAWSADTPAAYACGIAGETYDDNRHGTGGKTTPLNSLNITEADGSDGYHQVTKGAAVNNWLEDGLAHHCRLELVRPLQPSVNGVPGGSNFEYQIKVWIDCPGCSAAELAQFQDVKVSFTAWTPLIQKTIAGANPLVLNQTRHDELRKILFGFTQGTGGAVQNFTLRNFKLYFLKQHPANPAAW